MACVLSNGHVSDDVTWPWKVKLVTPIRLKRNISKTTSARDFKFGMQLCMGNAERARKNFPWSGRGLSHVTPKIFGIWSNISPKLLELDTSNLIHGFVWRMKSRRTKIFPKSRRGLGHVTPTILAVRSAILATAWLLVERARIARWQYCSAGNLRTLV